MSNILMTRQQVANHMNNKHPDPNAMYQVVQAWHKDIKGMDWNPQRVDIFRLEHAYQEALTGLAKHHGVHLLYDLRNGQNKFIKAF